MSGVSIFLVQRVEARASARRRVENIRESSDLSGFSEDRPCTEERARPYAPPSQSSQRGTAHLSETGAVTISAAFAAQVIGQILETNMTNPATALRAYDAALARNEKILNARADV
jgi:hypothetical protein